MTIIPSLEDRKQLLLGRVPMFVYATLKKGFVNNYLLDNSIYIGNATTCERLILVSNFGTPVLIKNEQCSTYGKLIKGEVYGVQGTNILDQLEGVGYQTLPFIMPCIFDDDETRRIICCRTYLDDSIGQYVDYENEEFLDEWV